MSKIDLEREKGELIVTRRVDSNNEGFIVSVMMRDDNTFVMRIKIITNMGDAFDVKFPLRLLRPFKGII